MKTILLFNSRCTKCNSIALTISQRSKGLITTRSLYDQDIQSVLTNIRPDWNWEPMMLCTDRNGNRKLLSGYSMLWRMVRIMGWKNSIVTWHALYPTLKGIDQKDRRYFLKGATGAILAAAGASLSSPKIVGAANNGIEADRSNAGTKALMEIISKSPEYQKYNSEFLSKQPISIVKNDGRFIVAFNVRPQNNGNGVHTVNLYPLMMFCLQDSKVFSVIRSIPDYDLLEWKLTELRSKDNSTTVAFSETTLKVVKKSEVIEPTAESSTQSGCCFCWCAQSVHHEGYLNGECNASCNIGCAFACSTPPSCGLCLAACFGLCWVSAYDECIDYDCGCADPCPQGGNET